LAIDLIIGYNSGYEIRNIEMGGACGSYGEKRYAYKVLMGKRKEIAHFDSQVTI
jgi:hypothetical protein